MVDEELSGSYLSSGFNQRLGFGHHPALVVVDFVDAYLVTSSPLYANVEEALDSAKGILKKARSAGIPIIYTVVEHSENGAGGGYFAKKVGALKLLAEGSPLGKIAELLTPLPGETIISKKYASAFFGTNLATDLRFLGCDSVILVGVSTSGCIRASAVDAMQYGFIPIVVRDAVGDRHPAPHEASLFDLDAKYADVVSEREVLDYLEGFPLAR